MSDESTATPMATKITPPKRGVSFLGAFLISLVVSMLVLGCIANLAYSKREKWLPLLASSNVSSGQGEIVLLKQQIDDQNQIIAGLQEKIAELSSAPPASAASPVDNERLAALEASLNAVQKSAQETQTLRDQLQQLTLLQQGLSQQVQQQASQSMPDLRLLASFQSLRTKALEGIPFNDTMQRFLALCQTHPNMLEVARKLEVYASSGRPTLEDLRQGFGESVKQYLLQKDGVDNSLGGKVKRNLAQFITVRKLKKTGNSPVAAINRAETDIQSGNIERARDALADLPADVQPFFAAWQEEAKAYSAIPALLSRLDQQLADLLMQSSANHAP